MFSTPAVAGSLLIVGSCNGMIRALHRESGLIVWEYDTGHRDEASFHGDPVVVENLFLIGTDGPTDDGIYALDLFTGNLRWRARVPSRNSQALGVATDMQTLEGRVYATSLADEVMCLRFEDGSLVWKYQSGYRPREWMLNGTPAMNRKAVFFGGLDGTAYALNREDGGVLWKKHLGESILTSVHLGSSGVVLGTTDGNIYHLDFDTGLITKQLDLKKKPSGPIVEAEGKLLVCTDWLRPSSELVCVDNSLSQIEWKLESPDGTSWSTPRPYYYEGKVFIGNTAGGVFEYRLADRQLLRYTHVGGVIRGIRLVSDILYVGDQDGTIYAIHR